MAILKTLIVKGVARFLTDAYMSTIKSGIWNGSTIQVGYGGTGVTSAKGDLYTPVFLSSSGITPCTVAIPHNTKDFKINGTTYSIFTTYTGTAPTIFAPTALAGTGGYILATKSDKSGLEWVAKPASNVTTSAVVSNSALGTTLIAAAQSDPYYNLIEGGAVASSILFKHGDDLSISASTGGVITYSLPNRLKPSSSQVNLDNVPDNGFYYTSSGNLPEGVSNGHFIATKSQSGYAFELLFKSNGTITTNTSYDASDLFLREYNGGTSTWGNWVTILTSLNLKRFVSQSATPVVLSSFNTEYTIATIGGVDLKIKTPANPNTWRNIYTSGTSRVGTATSTKAMNFVGTGNISIGFKAAGTGTGQSGSADYFTVSINADANAVGVAGYVAAPSSSTSNQVWMTNASGLPAWRAVTVPSTVPTIGTSDTTLATIGGITVKAKIGSYASSSHTHYYLVTSGDHRNVVTTPDDYTNKFTFVGLKLNSTLGISNASTYSYLIGLRGWSDHSGGGSHELAFNQTLGLLRRVATDSSTWGNWIRIADSSNIVNGNTTITWNTETTIATIAGVPIKIKIPNNPNVDTKVTQSDTTTANYRGIVLGYNTVSSATATGLTTTVTNLVYLTDNLRVQPSTGNIVSNGGASFGNNIIMSGSKGITSSSITDGGGLLMLYYSNGNNLGAFGDGTTATIPTYVRSTGNNLYHRRGNNSSYTDYLILDTANVSPSIGNGTTSTTVKITVGGVSSSDYTIPYAHSSSYASYLRSFHSIPSSTSNALGKWIKFATISLTSTWQAFDETLIFGGTENSQRCPNGILRITGRRSSDSDTVSNFNIIWITLDYNWFADKVVACKNGTNTYDLYISNPDTYTSMFVHRLTGNASSVSFSNGTWGDLPATASYTSSIGGYVNGANVWTTTRSFTIGNTSKDVNGSQNVSWSLSEIGASSASHTHSVKIHGNTKTIAAPGGTAVDLGNYVYTTGDSMSGRLNITLNLDTSIAKSSPTSQQLVLNGPPKPRDGWTAEQLANMKLYPGIGFYMPSISYASIIYTGEFRFVNSSFSEYVNTRAAKFITNGGTSAQFVKGDGSLDSNVYALNSSLGNYLPLTGGTVTGAVVIKKDLGGNLSEWALKQHNGPLEVGRNSNTMRVTMGVTDDDYGFIQCKGEGIITPGKLVLLPAGGNTLYFSRALHLIAHAGNISNKAATIGTSLTTIATIAGVDITAKIGSYLPSNHVYPLSIAANSGTNQLSLAASTKYKLTAGGSTFIFTTPPNNRRAYYGTCSTAAATAAKVVTLSDASGWELVAGTIVGIKFTNSNSASSVTLNVNSTGAKSIYYNNAVYTGSSVDVCGTGNRVTYYMYDGTYWAWLGSGYIINSTYSAIPLDEITTGTATTGRLITAKVANDWLHTKPHTISGKWIHNADIVLSTGNYIYGVDETSGAMLFFDGTRTVIGSSGETSTVATHIRSITGHATIGTNTNATYTILDTGNVSASVSSNTLTLTVNGSSTTFTPTLTNLVNTILNAQNVTTKSSTWTDVKTVNGYDAGTYVILISSTSNKMFASGVFSLCKDLDHINDEIPLHVSSTNNGWRPYAKINGNYLLMSSTDTSDTTRSYTIKIFKLI